MKEKHTKEVVINNTKTMCVWKKKKQNHRTSQNEEKKLVSNMQLKKNAGLVFAS